MGNRGDIIGIFKNEPRRRYWEIGIYISDAAMKLREILEEPVTKWLGIPGDSGDRNNVLYINDEPITEDYARIEPNWNGGTAAWIR